MGLKIWKSQGGRSILCVRCCLFLMVFTAWGCVLLCRCLQQFFTIVFDTSIPIYDVHPMKNGWWLTPESWHIYLAWMDVEYDRLYFLDCHMSLCWTVTQTLMMKLTGALSSTLNSYGITWHGTCNCLPPGRCLLKNVHILSAVTLFTFKVLFIFLKYVILWSIQSNICVFNCMLFEANLILLKHQKDIHSQWCMLLKAEIKSV
jgi:hypothetical protein